MSSPGGRPQPRAATTPADVILANAGTRPVTRREREHPSPVWAAGAVILAAAFVVAFLSTRKPSLPAPPPQMLAAGQQIAPRAGVRVADDARVPPVDLTVRSVRVAATPKPAPAAHSAESSMRWRIGEWTPELGVEIARRALTWLGTPYAWAGGNAHGPTRGTPVDFASRNDGNVIGFDCSGLVLQALAPWRTLDHLAARQYAEAGAVHPALDRLLPGDLIFWSPDGTVQGISHVAVYIGGGNVVQAPFSGSFVQVTPVNRVEPGAIGTTRPLT